MNLNPTQQAKFDKMSRAEKIAVLLMLMGEDTTASVFSNMSVDAITEVSKYIASNKSVEKAVAAAVLKEFYAIFQSQQFIIGGGIKYTKELLYRALDVEDADKILEKLSKTLQEDQYFSYLSKIKPQQLSKFLVDEHPQTTALILAHMDAVEAADTLHYFSDDLRSEVLIRIAKLRDISSSVIKRVSDVLKSKLELSSPKIKIGGLRAVAAILNSFDEKISKETFVKICEQDKEISTLIKDMMFSFEDIKTLEKKAIIEILKSIDKHDLMLALKSASPELRDVFFSVMSEKGKKVFEEESQSLGVVKMRDVKDAHRRVIKRVESLVEDEIIQLDLGKKEAVK
jgi:flagellar motor switch protein FliG